MKVVVADTAHADLKEIVDWVGADDWDSAESFRRALLDKCGALGSNPRRYPLVLRVGARDLPKLSYRDCLIFYRVLKSRGEVLRVVHGKRDWIGLLQVEDSEGAS